MKNLKTIQISKDAVKVHEDLMQEIHYKYDHSADYLRYDKHTDTIWLGQEGMEARSLLSFSGIDDFIATLQYIKENNK